MRMWHFLVVSLCAVGLWTGCGKEETTTTSEAPIPIESATAAPAPVDQPQAAPMPAPQQPNAAYDTLVADRAIVFAEGQLARKNWRAVRQSLAQLENLQLTPVQRQKVDAIKRQVPPQ